MVGQHLVRKLVNVGSDVYVIDDLSRGSAKVEGAKYILGDASSPHTCEWAFRGFSLKSEPVWAVFNLAASVAGVLHNMNHHHEMFHSNVMLQTVPVAVADSIGVPNFLQVSSVCIYPPEHNAPSREQYGWSGDPHPANAGYAWAKRMGELAVKWSSIERPIIVRPSNIYGVGDYFDERAHVIPALIKRATSEDVLTVYGSRAVSREFIYVSDAAEGMMAALARGKPKTEYNIGCFGENVVTMEELAHLVLHATEQTGKPVVFDDKLGGGDNARWADCTRAREHLGWAHRVPIESGLRRTYEWYEASRTDE